jgi:putative sigma-54 modulation protein
MRITVQGKNMPVSDALQRYAEKKVERLSRYFHSITDAQIRTSTQRNWHIVEVTLEGDGIILRGEERSDNMYASIDQVVEKLETQVKRFKSKLIERGHPEQPPKEHVATAPLQEEVAEAGAPEVLPRIVRSKRFPLKPMPPDEAATQMELLNHDFFVFLNSETDQVSVIYKRQDGNYGLIEPEF